MLENSDDLLSIVVLEAGAVWPAWLVDYQRLAPNAVVIAEARTESAASFEARVVGRVQDATASRGPRVRVGVMVLAELADRERTLPRKGIARALIQAMGASEEAELVLATSDHEPEASRHELFSLAGALCEELGGTHVNVRVRFSNPKSGIMRSVTGAVADVDVPAVKSRV